MTRKTYVSICQHESPTFAGGGAPGPLKHARLRINLFRRKGKYISPQNRLFLARQIPIFLILIFLIIRLVGDQGKLIIFCSICISTKPIEILSTFTMISLADYFVIGKQNQNVISELQATVSSS